MHLIAALIDFSKIQGWIGAVGYPALFGLLFACGLGLPLPEDIPLIISGALIAKGSMTWHVAAIVAWCGIIGGDCVLYSMGKKFGLEITRVPFVGRHVTAQRIKQVEVLFEKYGVAVIGIGRLIAGIRGAMVVCAGAIRYNFITFIIADGFAAIVSGGLWMLLGHWLGTNLTEERIKPYERWFWVGGAILVLGLIFWIIRQRRHPAKIGAAGVKAVETIAKAEKSVVDKIVRKHPTSQEPQAK
jgi:membrane protein DedA with SNARE-associated domain